MFRRQPHCLDLLYQLGGDVRTQLPAQGDVVGGLRGLLYLVFLGYRGICRYIGRRRGEIVDPDMRRSRNRPGHHLVAIGDLLLDVVVDPSRPVERGTDVPGTLAFRRGGSAGWGSA